MKRLQLTAADVCGAAIGGLIGLGLVLGNAESWRRRAARR